MAEKEFKVKVTTETDVSSLNDLKSTMEEVQQSAENLGETASNSLDNISSSAEETSNSISDADDSVNTLGTDLDAVDSSGLDDASSSADGLSNALDNVNGQGLDNASESANNLKDNLDNATNSTSSLDSAMGAVAGVASAAGFMGMVDTAGRIEDSWNRLELTFGSVSNDMKQDINSAADATGRAGGLVRGYFNTMGIAGVRNTDLLRDSFTALSGRAYQTNTSIESMENAVKRMVMTGNAGSKQLQMLGITTEDLGRAMGVTGEQASKAFESLSQEDRLKVLTKAMGDGKKANEDYKNSWQGVKDQASAAFAYLMGAVGTPILQMLIPIMKTSTAFVKGLIAGFKALPGPIQTLIGGIGGGIMIFASLVGTLGVVGKAISGLKSGIEVIRGLSIVTRTLGGLSSLISGLGGAFSGLFGILLANPIMLVVVAIAALVAILVYLYFTNEDVRNAINAFGQALMDLGGIIYGYIIGAFEYLQGAWQNTVDWFTNGATLINDTVTAAFTWLSDVWNTVVNAFMTYAPLVAQILFVMATGGVGAIVLLVANFMGMPNQVGGALQNVINRVVGFVSSLVSNFTNGARNSVNNFLNQIRSLPGQFVAELNRMLSAVERWAATLPQKFWEAGVNAVKNFLNALGINSPGFMAVNFGEEIERLEKSASNNSVADNIGGTARDIMSAWGNPVLSVTSQPYIDDVVVNDGLDIMDVLKQILDALNNLRGNEPSMTFNLYGDMDEEKRMQKFLEAVRKDMAWNNKTAGRTIDG